MRILVLGSGNMAANHVRHFRDIDGVEVVAAADVVAERAAQFCEVHAIERSFGSLVDALAWGDFDAVANVTPDAVHYPTTMAAIGAGKHVFCEKPLSTDYPTAAAMVGTRCPSPCGWGPTVRRPNSSRRSVGLRRYQARPWAGGSAWPDHRPDVDNERETLAERGSYLGKGRTTQAP